MALSTLKSFLACITLGLYLIVGTLVVRVISTESTSVNFNTSYLNLFSPTELKSVIAEKIEVPNVVFSDIKFPEAKRVAKVVVAVAKSKVKKIEKNELPFQEAVVLSPIHLDTQLENNLVSLYTEYRYEAVALNNQIEDSVRTTASVDAEPEFFDYPKVEEKKEELSTTPQFANNVDDVENVGSVDKDEEVVDVEDLIAFDYSKVNEDLKTQTLSKVSKVTTQQTNAAMLAPAAQAPVESYPQVKAPKQLNKLVTTQSDNRPAEQNTQQNEDHDDKPSHGFVSSQTYPHQMTIQVTGTNLETLSQELGFEVRYQDDLNDVKQDYNSGEIRIEEELSQPKMTRSVTVLKRGFAPTNTDLIMEAMETKLSLPIIDEDTFNKLLEPYESRGPIGAVLVELEEKTEGSVLDVPYSKVLKLDEKMRITESNDFSYELFVGVKAGNSLLSYKDNTGKITSKIIHVHERELTFESNFYEEVSNEEVELLEEDLLGKDKTPLIISSEEVKEFATNKTSKKINNNTYQMDFQKTLLGSRRYLELTHQAEAIFIGFKDNQSIEVPSENFMRFILSRFEGSKLGNRCVVQINLDKKAVKADVSSESISSSLQTFTQILDSDGKFYDSISEKSRKIIIVGENQGGSELGLDSKINVKVSYEDGSSQFLGSYCSANTYLVEQL